MASWDEPPRFGPHGEAPPVRTDPVLISEGFTLRIAPMKGNPFAAPISRLMAAAGPDGGEFEQAREWLLGNYSQLELADLQTRNSYSSRMEREAAESARFYGALARGLKGKIRGEAGWPSLFVGVVLFRLRMYYFWEREDPLTRLPAGANGKITIKVTVGLSTAISHEISASLGAEVNLPGGVGKISHQEAIKDAITLTRTEQREDSRELTLPSRATGTRRYAIWQRERELHVEALGNRRDEIFWRPIITETFNAAPAIVATSDADT
jgi:hypothetical protein